MNWLVENWYLIIVFVALAAVVIGGCIYFFKLPSSTQIANIKEWLKFAVTEAEQALGGGTGQLKLHMVYDMAVAKFPWLLKIVSFDTFSKWVDEALEWLKSQLSTNEKVKAIVEKTESNGGTQ